MIPGPTVGHAGEICSRGHEECSDRPGGICYRPDEDPGTWPTRRDAGAAAARVATGLGHALYLAPSAADDVRRYRCPCGLGVALHEDGPDGTWRISGLALLMPHQPPLQKIPRPALPVLYCPACESDNVRHYGDETLGLYLCLYCDEVFAEDDALTRRR